MKVRHHLAESNFKSGCRKKGIDRDGGMNGRKNRTI